jgi:hypothetical protein
MPFLLGPFGRNRPRSALLCVLFFHSVRVVFAAALTLVEELAPNFLLRVMHAQGHRLVARNKITRFQFLGERSFVTHATIFDGGICELKRAERLSCCHLNDIHFARQA